MENNNVKSGIGFFELLGVAFIILKLCGVINWAWGWVLAPIWIPFALVGVILIVYLIIVIGCLVVVFFRK